MWRVKQWMENFSLPLPLGSSAYPNKEFLKKRYGHFAPNTPFLYTDYQSFRVKHEKKKKRTHTYRNHQGLIKSMENTQM